MESITLIIDPILDPEAVVGLAPGLGKFWGCGRESIAHRN